MTDNNPGKFGFIVHCRTVQELRLAMARYRLSPRSILPEKKLKRYCLERGFVEHIFTFDEVVSDKQSLCRGRAYCLLLTPDQMLENQTAATELVIKAGTMAETWGADIIGLGAICAVVGARGAAVASSCSAAVTTGNSLTVYASIVAFEKIMRQLGADPLDYRIAVVGFPGSISLAITKMLHAQGHNLIVVSRQSTGFLKKFLESLSAGPGTVEVTQDLRDALNRARIVFTATSSGQIIDQDMLLPGSIVLDIAQPKDVIYRKNRRKDVLVLDAGTIALPRATKKNYRYSGFGLNDIPSCLGETMTLAFEKRRENFSMGRELLVDRIREIGRLSEQHGFIFDGFRSFGKAVVPEHFKETQKALLVRRP